MSYFVTSSSTQLPPAPLPVSRVITVNSMPYTNAGRVVGSKSLALHCYSYKDRCGSFMFLQWAYYVQHIKRHVLSYDLSSRSNLRFFEQIWLQRGLNSEPFDWKSDAPTHSYIPFKITKSLLSHSTPDISLHLLRPACTPLVWDTWTLLQ